MKEREKSSDYSQFFVSFAEMLVHVTPVHVSRDTSCNIIIVAISLAQTNKEEVVFAFLTIILTHFTFF